MFRHQVIESIIDVTFCCFGNQANNWDSNVRDRLDTGVPNNFIADFKCIDEHKGKRRKTLPWQQHKLLDFFLEFTDVYKMKYSDANFPFI